MTVIIVGFGSLGKAIYDYACSVDHLEVGWVWNRSLDKLLDLPEDLILEDLEDIHEMPRRAEIIVEVAHPNLWKDHAEDLLKNADVLIGSPSGLSDKQVESSIRHLCKTYNRTAFIGRGALWGSEDISRMAETTKDITITMRKHPSHLKVLSPLKEMKSEEKMVVLYEGPVRDLCPLAPNNVNTMACLAIFGIGFDRTVGRLVSDPDTDSHHITIEITGTRPGFKVTQSRTNPAPMGNVTGLQTYNSFLKSLDCCLTARRNSSFALC